MNPIITCNKRILSFPNESETKCALTLDWTKFPETVYFKTTAFSLTYIFIGTLTYDGSSVTLTKQPQIGNYRGINGKNNVSLDLILWKLTNKNWWEEGWESDPIGYNIGWCLTIDWYPSLCKRISERFMRVYDITKGLGISPIGRYALNPFSYQYITSSPKRCEIFLNEPS